MQRVRDTAGSVRNWFTDLRLVQKVGIIGIAVVVLGVLVGVRLTTRPQFGVLYTDLAGDDYNKVVNWLDTNNVRFRAEGGDAVLVHQQEAPVIRARMAVEGIPASGHIIGKEDLDKSSFSESRPQFRKRVERMAEGEVTRSILLLDEVRSAKVNIAFPEEEPLFQEDRVPLTASVAITAINPNVRFTPATVDAVASIVSHSVSGLDPKAVSIVDSRGRAYSVAAAREGIDPELVVERENARRVREKELEDKLRDEIGAVVGPKNVRLVASIELDWTTEKSSERVLLPDESGRGFKISEQHETEDYKGPGPQAGVPGVEPNVPPPPEGAPPTYPVTETGPISYSRTQDTINQDYGERNTEKTAQAPRVARKNIGIFLNESEVAAAEGARIEQAAIVAAGIDRARGDMLVVQRVPFAEEALPKAAPTWVERWGRWLVPAVLAFCGVLVPLVMSWMAAPPPPVPPPLELEEELEEGLAEELPEETLPLEAVPWDRILEEPELPDELAIARAEIQRRTDELFEAIKTVALERPQEFANALRVWLFEE